MIIEIHGINFEAESLNYDQFGMAEIWFKWDAMDISSRQKLANLGIYSNYDPARDLSRLFVKSGLVNVKGYSSKAQSACECGRDKHKFIEHMFYCPMWKVDNGEK